MGMNKTPIDPRKFREVDDRIMASTAVSPEEIKKVKEAMDKLEQKAEDKIVAEYKIEILFGVKHSVHNTAYGVMTLWESGSKLHGGGDALLYVCPGKSRKYNECDGIIPDAVNGFSMVPCPTCGMVWKREELIGDTFYRLPMSRWADVILYWFVKLKMNADIRIKYHYRDIRKAAEEEQQKNLRGEKLLPARDEKNRIPRIYPLANIIKDTAAGADLYSRILDFVRM